MASLRERLRAHERGLEGLFVGGEGPGVVEQAGLAGFDYVVLDGEHGAVWDRMPDLIRAAHLVGLAALVRVPLSRPDGMAWVLDMGADGVLIPGVTNQEEIERVVGVTRYPPQGRRGLALTTPAARYTYERQGYLARARSETAVVIQVETAEALEQLETWAGVSGVDAFFAGPSDLSMALGEEGIPGPKVTRALARVREVFEAKDTPWGVFTGSAAARQAFIDEGAALVATAVPLVLSQGFSMWRGGNHHA